MDLAECAEIARSFARLVGPAKWRERMLELQAGCKPSYAGKAVFQLHALELTLEKVRRPGRNAPLAEVEKRVAGLAAEVLELARSLPPRGRARLDEKLGASMVDSGTLVPVFHLVRTARLHRQRGFDVAYAGLEDGASFDLLIARGGAEAEIVCDVVSAEAGRDVRRRAWMQLMDRVDPDLQDWLASHPGRYLLKMTLPQGLDTGDEAPLAQLHRRITRLLSERRRADQDEAAILRLDPLMLAAAQAGENGLMPRLRREFGPEAHLAVTADHAGILVVAARAGREDEVAAAVHRRLEEIAPQLLTGERPGILAMFVEDTDRLEWFRLRDSLQLEGEARHFLTKPAARHVAAVTCTSRLELLDGQPVIKGAGTDLRFRNPGHAGAHASALAEAVSSSA